jgi:fibro-slime domain-containing protein
MKKPILLISLSLLHVATSALPAQTWDQANEGLNLTRTESGDPLTPYHQEVNWWAKVGRTYIVEETDDLTNLTWRRLPQLRTSYGSEFAGGSGRNYESGPVAFDTNTSKHFVRLRYVDGLLDPFGTDCDRDGVSNYDEVMGAQTDPFGYPDEDSTDADNDGLPDAWERYRFGNLDHYGAELLGYSTTQTYADLYQAQRKDMDGDGLPDDWERFRNSGSLAENAATTHDGVTNLVRYRQDRVRLTMHRYGAQIFSYDSALPTNAFEVDPENPLRVFLRGSSGGSMIVQYSNSTYSAISSVRVWPSNSKYGTAKDELDLATHYADYIGTLVNGVYDYTFSATPATGTYVARDLLRSLDGIPLTRSTVDYTVHRAPARLAITSIPLTSVGPSAFPVVLRDFPYDSPHFPEFGGDNPKIGYGALEPVLDGPPLIGYPQLKQSFKQQEFDSGQRFANWYSLSDAFGFNLPVLSNSDGTGISKISDFFPQINDVGTVAVREENRHGFTVELHLWLDYDLASTSLHVSSDDDCWIFIDGRLAVDQGGRHLPWTDTYPLANLKAQVKTRDGESTPFLETETGSCRVDVFYAERATSYSSLAIQSNSPLRPVYVYQIVCDTDVGTTLTYSLTQAPAGMAIDPKTGRIFWDYLAINRDANPANDLAAGVHAVTVSVTDARGLQTTQSFSITLSL